MNVQLEICYQRNLAFDQCRGLTCVSFGSFNHEGVGLGFHGLCVPLPEVIVCYNVNPWSWCVLAQMIPLFFCCIPQRRVEKRGALDHVSRNFDLGRFNRRSIWWPDVQLAL